MKLCPAITPVTIIGTNYTNAELLRLVEQHFTHAPPLLKLLIDRFGGYIDRFGGYVVSERPGGPAMHLEEKVAVMSDGEKIGNCPGCGCELIIIEQ